MIKRVLLGIGGTPFTTVAIRRAVELCLIHDAELTAVTVVDEQRLGIPEPVTIGSGNAASELRQYRAHVTRERVNEALDQFVSACRVGAVRYAIHRESGDALGLIRAHARYHDVTVFGLRSMFEYDVLGAIAEEPAEVLNRLVADGVRPIVAVSENYRKIRRVLVAYGGSTEAARTMKSFVHLRPWPNLTLRLLACGRPPQEAERDLADAADYCRTYGYQTETCHRSASPDEAILAEAADWDADLIVLGCSGRSSLSQAFFGTTALHVIRNADRPVFLGQ